MAKPREKFKTYGDVFDNYTNRLLFKLISQGHFVEDSLSPVALGKEGNVFTALTEEGTKVIIKIYRLETSDFNRMYEYIRVDPRYNSIPRSRRKVIFMWSQREYRNLMKAREVIRVPMPITFKDNVLILEMIGDESPAPKLKDAEIPDPQKTANTIITDIKKLYHAGFVHGDLSEFNILMWNGEPVFIDFSHTTPTLSNRAKELLERDVENICRFFRKHGLELQAEAILDEIYAQSDPKKSKT